MKKNFVLLIFFGATACHPFSEFSPDATKDQVNAILTVCRVKTWQIERQDENSNRWVVVIAAQEPDQTKKMRCLDSEQARLGVSFTRFGP